MSGRSIAEVALKTWAILMLAQVVIGVPSTLILMTAQTGPDDQWTRSMEAMQVVGLLAGILVGLCLLIWGKQVSEWVIPETATLQIGVDANQLSVIAFALVGVFLLAGGLQDAISLGYIFIHKRLNPLYNQEYLWIQEQEVVVNAILHITVGVFLILGRKGIGKTWSRLREFPTGSQGG